MTRRLHLVCFKLENRTIKCIKCGCILIDPEAQVTTNHEDWNVSLFNCSKVEKPKKEITLIASRA